MLDRHCCVEELPKVNSTIAMRVDRLPENVLFTTFIDNINKLETRLHVGLNGHLTKYMKNILL